MPPTPKELTLAKEPQHWTPCCQTHSSTLPKFILLDFENLKFDDGHSRPNTTNPSKTGPCQLSDTAARLKGVLEKRVLQKVCVAECPRSTSMKQGLMINKLIMINLSDQSHQTNSCNLKQVCREFQRTTCHLHRSCSSRLPRWDSLHEAMAPWIGASASERPWDSAFYVKTYPNLDIQHHPIYPVSRSDSVSDFIRPGTPETMTSSSWALSGTIQGWTTSTWRLTFWKIF